MFIFISFLIVSFIALRYFRRYFNGPNWSEKADMAWKTVIVTGASAGIGKETALDLLERGATVYFACRDEAKTRAVISKIKNNDARSRAIFLKLDLSSIESVVNFVKEFKKKSMDKIDILINNAGLISETFSVTKDGIEMSLQANHIGHMALTYLLLDYFNDDEARIINVSSRGHRRSNYTVDEIKRLKNNLNFEGEEVGYGYAKAFVQYGNTKIGNIFFTQHLAELLEKKYPHIKTASLHPGLVNTEFTRFVDNVGFIYRVLIYLFLYPLFWYFSKDVKTGAQTTLALCYMDFEKMQNGQYYADCERIDTYPIAKNEELRKEFMEYSWMLLDKVTDKYSIPRFLR